MRWAMASVSFRVAPGGSSTLNGATTTHVTGAAWQTLNSSQSNSGNQSASVSGSNACAFGVLN